MKVLNGLPLVDVAYFQFPFAKLSKPLWHSTGSRFLSRKAKTSPSIDDRRATQSVQRAASFVDKSLSIERQATVKRVAIEISTNVTRVTRRFQRLIHPLSFSTLLLLNRNGMYLNIFARFQKTIIREDSSIIRPLYARYLFPFSSLLFILNSLNSLYEI